MLHNIPEERTYHQHLGRSLKSGVTLLYLTMRTVFHGSPYGFLKCLCEFMRVRTEKKNHKITRKKRVIIIIVAAGKGTV
jgi:hypothetical protein